MNSSAYHPSFFVKFFVQPIYTKYAYNEKKITLKSSPEKHQLKWSLVGPLLRLCVITPTVHHSSWLALLLVEISLNDKKTKRIG